MLGCLLLVIAMITRLQKPETHAAIGQVLGTPTETVVSAAPLPEPLVGPAAFAEVVDNGPFRNAEQPAWFAVLEAVATAEANELADNSAGVLGYAALSSQPDTYRGRVVTVSGKVLRVEPVTPAENDFGVETLWRSTLQPTGGEVWPMTVYTLEEPAAPTEPYDTVATGVFFKKLSYRWAEGVGSTPVVVAKRLGAGPSTPDATSEAVEATPDVSFELPSEGSLGRKLLADLGVDLATVDAVTDRQRLLSRESEAFYAVLGAIERTPAAQLVRLARVGLDDYVARHRGEAAKTRRGQIELRSIEAAKEAGGYSAVPFFGAATRERGELIVLDTVVRRAVRIDATGSQTAANAGVDHYYELEAFPEDSQNLPIVFVVRDLPAGFPLGESIRQPARLAGFFFKQWAYRTRHRAAEEPRLDKRQFAPLLIGRAPIPLATPDASQRPGLAIGVVATVALAGVVAALWRLGRRDREYTATTLSRYREPEESLDFERLGSLDSPTRDADAPVSPALDSTVQD